MKFSRNAKALPAWRQYTLTQILVSNLQWFFTLVILFGLVTTQAQQAVDLIYAGTSFYNWDCPVPNSGTIKVRGSADNFNSTTDSIRIRVNWGDGTFDIDTVPLYESGITDTFNLLIPHTYNIGGTYTPEVIATSGGFTDTIYANTSVIYNNCAYVSGYVYSDINSNCTLDVADDTLRGAPIIFYHNGAMITWAMTDTNGYYNAAVPSGLTGVTIKLSHDTNTSNWSLACPTTGQYTFNSTAYHVFNFGVECTGTDPDFFVGAFWASAGLPGQCGTISFISAGATCDTQNVTTTLVLDTNTSYNGMISGPAPTTMNNNVLTWDHTVNPSYDGWRGGLRAAISICTDTGSSLSTQVCFELSTTNDTVDSLNNFSNKCVPLGLPYDPNNKIVNAPTLETNGNTAPDSKLTYRVNFQNTGTAPAINVYILDTISDNLNLETIKILASSHEMTPRMVADRVVRFNFKNINLPDSNANEPKSHGFFIYSIEMKDSLAVGTEIYNTAHIYFDYNAPIITNTTYNIVYVAPEVPDTLILQLNKRDVTCINSDNGSINLNLISGNPPYNYAWSNGASTKNLENLSPGTYTVTVTDSFAQTAMQTIQVIENRIHDSPAVGNITGTLEVQSWKPFFYVVPTNGNSSFEWSAIGGEIVQSTANTAEVLWNAGPIGTVTATETDINGCIGTSDLEVAIQFVGIHETEAKNFSLYPNPTSGIVTLELKEWTGSDRFEIIDLQGRLVFQAAIDGQKSKLDLSTLSSGTYTVRYISEAGSSEGSLIKH